MASRRKVGFKAVERRYTLDEIEEVKDALGGIDFLQQAAREGNVEGIQQYLTSRHFLRRKKHRGATTRHPIDKLDSQGIAAMHYAARYNHIDVMQILVDNGADVNVKDSDGQTPMHFATRYAPRGTALNAETVMFVPRGPSLLNIKENEDEVDEMEDVEEEDTPEEAVDMDSSEVENNERLAEEFAFKYLKKFFKRADKKDKSVKDQIAEESGSEPIRFLKENGADINAQDNYGLTPLHCAADRGNYPAVFELLKFPELLVDQRDYQGETALHMAIMFEDALCIRKMLYNKLHPCNPTIYSHSNMSPLHFASREASLEILELLFGRLKMVEMKECLASILSDQNKESVMVSRLCSEIGVRNIRLYDKHVSTLVKRLHEKVSEVYPEEKQLAHKMINQKFKQALLDTDKKMQQHINKGGQERMTCLHFACKDGRPDVVKFLIENGANLKARTVDKDTALHIAAKHAHVEVCRLLINGGCPKEAKNRESETAIHEAVKSGSTDIVELLLDMGCNIEAQDSDGATPLIKAAAWGRKDTVKLLLERDCDLDARDKRENSAVFAAIQENQPDVLSLILEKGGPRLVDSELDQFQNTPLHFAAEEGHLQCLKVLLQFGFEPNAQNEDDKCPLHLAADKGRVKCVKELVYKDKQTIDDNDDFTNTPLHYAALNGHVETCVFLCEMGAEVGARNQTGWTPMDCAAANGNTKTIAALLDSDAEIDPLDKAKLTPLHLASKRGHLESTLFLLDKGANIKLIDVNGYNALELAILANKKDVAMGIINHGVDTWIRAMSNEQPNGDTPMKKLIRKMPAVAEMVMNKCTDLSNNPPNRTTDSRKFEVEFNYRYITDKAYHDPLAGLETDSSVTDTTSSEYSTEATTSSRVDVTIAPQESYHLHPLTFMINYKRKKLLNHPLVQSLIFCKWTSYGKKFYYGNLFIYIIFLTAITTFSLSAHAPYHAFTENTTGNVIRLDTKIPYDAASNTCCINYPDKYNSGNCPKSFYCSTGTSTTARVSGTIVIVFCVIRIIIEFVQLYFQKLKYLSLLNMVEVVLFCTAIYFTSSIFFGDVMPSHQWQIGTFCLLIAWMNMLIFLQKFPGIGIYIVMFVTVLKTFLKIGVVLVIFIISFGITFSMIIDQFPSYHRSWFSIVRTFVMMTGEMEFDSYFTPTEINKPTNLFYPEITFVIFIIFVIVVPIVFVNLLVGLAVDDIKEVFDDAGIQRSIMKIQLIFQVELLLPLSYLEKRNKPKKLFRPNIRYKYLGSRILAKYFGPPQLSFTGTELYNTITNADENNEIKEFSEESKVVMSKIKKRVQEVSKQNKKLLKMLQVMIQKNNLDRDSVSSDLYHEERDEELDVDD